jgi:RimJ/RimL family protein N-acetyltransferase
MRLIDLYDYPDGVALAYQLLEERQPRESISHKCMPTRNEHIYFVCTRPYAHWYVVEVDSYPRGTVYLSREREIGVAILKGQRGHNYGLNAVAELMRLHPGRFLANINPANEASIALFRKLGFGGPIQITLEKSE